MILKKKQLYLYLLLMICLTLACSKNKIINKNEMADILCDMYIADVISENQRYSMDYNKRDSIAVYGPIFAKYGYDINDFNQSILHYAREINGIEFLYDRVKNKLEAQKITYEPEARLENLRKNFWAGSDSLHILEIDRIRALDFDISLTDTGRYRISAEYAFYSDDSTKNNRLVAWLISDLNPDSIYSKIDTLLVKDTLYKAYQLDIHVNDIQNNRLKGHWLSCDSLKTKPIKLMSLKSKTKPKNNKKEFKQNVRIRKLAIKYTSPIE